MTSFFSKDTKKGDRTLCVCSITSYAVTASVVRVLHHESAATNPVVLFSCEEKIPAYHDRDPQVLTRVALLHTKYALERCRSFQGAIDTLVCTIGEPWIVTYFRSAHLERAEPFKVLQKTIDDVVTREKRVFEQEILENYTEGDIEMGIVDISRPSVVVNGYPINELSNIPARTLDVHLSVSMAPVVLFEGLVGVYADVFHRTDVVFQSADIARSYAFARRDTATVLDIGGLSSSLSVFDHGRVLHEVALPVGLIDLEEGLRDVFGMKSLHLSSLMRLAEDDRVLEHERGRFAEKITTASALFCRGIERGMLELKRRIPQVSEPVSVFSGRNWLTVVQSGIQGAVGEPISLVQPQLLAPVLTFARGAETESSALALAILQAVQTTAA